MGYNFKFKPIVLRQWSAKEKACVRDMYLDGYSDNEIADKLGRSIGSIGQQRHQLGLKRSTQPGKEFKICDAMAEYYPTWYKRLLKQRWQERYSMQ